MRTTVSRCAEAPPAKPGAVSECQPSPGGPLAGLRTRAPRVVCVGLSAYDLTWEVDALPAGAGKRRASEFRMGGGGMAANAAVAVAQLGGKAHFWGRAGDDMAGREMREELARRGVDVSAFRLFEGGRSSMSGIVVDPRGERAIVNFRGAGLPADPAWLPCEVLRDAHAVLADPRWPEGARAAFEAARTAGVPTVLDADVAEAETFDTLLPHTDYAVFSEPGLDGYAAAARDIEAKLVHALRAGCRLSAVTLGAQGVLWHDGHALHRLPAFAVRAIDTTGAGDVFHGALAWSLGAGLESAHAFRFSSAAAALKCTRPGGRAGAPDLPAVMSFLAGFEG